MPAISSHAVDVYPYRTEAGGATVWLVLRRSPGWSDAGRWRMVGGKRREGEAAWEAALRELSEETGWRPGVGLLDVWTIPSLNAFYEWDRDRLVLVPAFAARVAGDPRLDDEHDAWEWLPASEAAARLAWPEQARLLGLAARLAGTDRPEAWAIPLGPPR